MYIYIYIHTHAYTLIHTYTHIHNSIVIIIILLLLVLLLVVVSLLVTSCLISLLSLLLLLHRWAPDKQSYKQTYDHLTTWSPRIKNTVECRSPLGALPLSPMMGFWLRVSMSKEITFHCGQSAARSESMMVDLSYTLRWWGVTWCYIRRFARDVYEKTTSTVRRDMVLHRAFRARHL